MEQLVTNKVYSYSEKVINLILDRFNSFIYGTYHNRKSQRGFQP